MACDVAGRKQALRAAHRERRRKMPGSDRDAATEGITRNLTALVTRLRAQSLTCYLSSPAEPDTRPFLAWAAQRGITALLPISRDDGILDWAAGDGTTGKRGRFGVPEPAGDALGPAAADGADLIIVPASAVDSRGFRLGWGRGYFDRMLGGMQSRPPVYALLFDGEIVDSVPRENHDQPVDGAITPSRVVQFSVGNTL